MQGLLSNELMSKSSIFGGGRGSSIKSIQRGQSVIVNGDYNKTITISPVNLVNSIVVIHPIASNYYNVALETASIKFLNSTSIFAARMLNTGWSCSFVWEVIEFENVKSKQIGEFSVLTGEYDKNIAINSVNTAKCLVVTSLHCDVRSTEWGYAINQPFLQSATVLNVKLASNGASNVTRYILWQIIEFN
jgi:hypothetical protein